MTSSRFEEMTGARGQGSGRLRIAVALCLALAGLCALPVSAGAALVVEKTASPTSLPAPGGEFLFKVRVINTGANFYWIDSIVDDVYGDLATRPGSDCGEITNGNTHFAARLFPAGNPNFDSTARCTFTGNFTGVPGDVQTDTVTVTATDVTGPPAPPVIATDTATVAITKPGTRPGVVRIRDSEITCKDSIATITGSTGPDELSGTPGPDVIVGLDGDDVIRGRGGKDRICGGKGEDELRGGAANDRLNGGSDDDFCSGGSGRNDTAVACQEIVGVP
jgi:Ca2+-binding RTX toxin-like protein